MIEMHTFSTRSDVLLRMLCTARTCITVAKHVMITIKVCNANGCLHVTQQFNLCVLFCHFLLRNGDIWKVDALIIYSVFRGSDILILIWR